MARSFARFLGDRETFIQNMHSQSIIVQFHAERSRHQSQRVDQQDATSARRSSSRISRECRGEVPFCRETRPENLNAASHRVPDEETDERSETGKTTRPRKQEGDAD